jgi:hypothetical protein
MAVPTSKASEHHTSELNDRINKHAGGGGGRAGAKAETC